MTNPLKIGLLPVTQQIVIGRVNEKTGMWVGDRTDITENAVSVVADYLKQTGQELKFMENGKVYKLAIVEEPSHD